MEGLEIDSNIIMVNVASRTSEKKMDSSENRVGTTGRLWRKKVGSVPIYIKIYK